LNEIFDLKLAWGTHISIFYSPDLRHWGSHKLMLAAVRGGSNKIGRPTSAG
jgi:predicted GH43/DUF377 family glycosyl hydrolase